MNRAFSSNIAFNCEEQMHQICQPLFYNTQINYFNYVKLLDDQLHISLSTCTQWMKFFLDNRFYKESVFEKIELNFNNRVILWDLFEESPKIRSAQRDIFNIDHGITLINKLDTEVEYFCFASTPGNHQVNNFYINNLALLDDFICYFKEKGQYLIQSAQAQPIAGLN